MVIALLVGCTETVAPAPDAAARTVDAGTVETDACTREASHDCCDLLPDENAVRECSYEGLSPGDCGVAICWHADCTRTQVNFCVPL